jgi:hypothetical protein
MVFIPVRAPSLSSYNMLHLQFQMVMEAVVTALLTLLTVLSSCVSLLFLHWFDDISPTSSNFLSNNFISLILFCATVSLSFISSLVFLFFHSLSSLFAIFTSLLLLLGVSHKLFLRFYSFVSFSLFKLTDLYFLHQNIYLSFLLSLPYVFIYFHFPSLSISLSTALFSLYYVTVACDIYNIIKLYIKLTLSLIVSCITYWIEQIGRVTYFVHF